MISTKKYYYLPIVDHLSAVGIALLIMFLFGSWLFIPVVTPIATFIMLFTLCGRTYVRMWNLSRKNTLRHYGLQKNDFIKFLLPIVIVDLVLIVFYLLCDYGVIPLKEVITKSYYVFPDNEPRTLETNSAFGYVAFFVKLWFVFLSFIFKNGFSLLIAPVLSFTSGMLGYYFGAKDKQLINSYINITEKIKKKFNE